MFNKKKYLLAFIIILLLGFFLRKNDLFTWPRLGATFDEYAWTWQGINLIQKGIPVSWSPHPQYKNAKEITYQKTAFRLVTPFLEHPPLFGIVAGTYAIASGAKDMYHISLQNIRGLALILGLLSIVMIFIFVSEIIDVRTGLLASLLYATIPTVVVGSRIVQNENFFMPFFLLSLFFTSRFIKTKKSIYRNLAAVISGLLILAKIPWVAASLSIVMIFLFLKKYSDAFKFLAIVIPIALLFFAYGFYYDKDLFLNLWRFQLNRYDMGFTSIFALFQKPYLVDRFYTDGWIYFGWFAFILLLLKDLKKNIFIVFPFLAYFLIFLAGVPDEPGHGWYRYPFYPFLIISTAVFLKDYFTKNWLLTFFFLVLVGASLLQQTWAVTFGFSYFIFRSAIILWSFSLLPLVLRFEKIGKYSKLVSYSWLVIFILFNIWSVMLYTEQ